MERKPGAEEEVLRSYAQRTGLVAAGLWLAGEPVGWSLIKKSIAVSSVIEFVVFWQVGKRSSIGK
jgi:hypothetical protein